MKEVVKIINRSENTVRKERVKKANFVFVIIK